MPSVVPEIIKKPKKSKESPSVTEEAENKTAQGETAGVDPNRSEGVSAALTLS